jgi:AcrR family transcriptional regulator
MARTARRRDLLIPAKDVQRRLPGAKRRDRIVEKAAEVFAEEGFAATTRELARRLGVTQALIYKFYPSKQCLIDAVYATVFRDRFDPAWTEMLSDRSTPVGERIAAFYIAYHDRMDEVALKLFVRAGLAGMPLPGARGARLTDQIFAPITSGLRELAALPPLDQRPMVRGERELCMQLHGSIVFLAIRRHVYRMRMPSAVDDLIRMYVATFVDGAPATLRRLHAGEEGDNLRVTQLRPAREC